MKRLILFLLFALATTAHAGGYDNFSTFSLDWSGGNNSRLAFYTPLTSTANIITPPRAYPGTAATFSRASAQYITDFEGVTRKVESGSIAVEGSRVVTNLLTYSEDLSNVAWVVSNAAVTKSGNTISFDAGALCRVSQTLATALPPGSTAIITMSFPASEAGKTFRLVLLNDGVNRYSSSYTVPVGGGRFSHSYTATGTGISSAGIANVSPYDPISITISSVQLENVTSQTNTNPGGYVKTTSAAASECFSTTNGNTVNMTTGVVTESTGTDLPTSYPERANSTAYTVGQKIQANGWWYTCTTGGTSHSSAPTWLTGKTGLVTVTDGTVTWTLGGRLLLGYVSEPASTNKTTAYGIIPVDTLGSELSSGSLTIGQKYQITARTDANFVADGAADNVVGTQFVATAATVPLDAGDKVKRVQWGVGEKSFHNGSAFVQNITGLTLSGDVAGVLSIISGTTLTTNAGLLGISTTGKLYQDDNTTGSAASVVTVTGTAGNTNKHSGSIYIAKISGSGTSTIEINGTTTTITGATLQRFKVENATPASGSQFVINTGIGDKVQFCLMGFEESVFATSLNPSAGSTSTRAATILSFPVAGNLTSPLWSAKITATPMAASQDGKYMLGSYYDANNGVGLLMSGANAVARKRLAGSNNDATKALTLVAGTTKRFGLRGSGSGWSLFVDGVKGTDSANTATPAAGTTLQIGLDGNSGNGFSGYFRDLYLYNKPLADGRF